MGRVTEHDDFIRIDTGLRSVGLHGIFQRIGQLLAPIVVSGICHLVCHGFRQAGHALLQRHERLAAVPFCLDGFLIRLGLSILSGLLVEMPCLLEVKRFSLRVDTQAGRL